MLTFTNAGTFHEAHGLTACLSCAAVGSCGEVVVSQQSPHSKAFGCGSLRALVLGRARGKGEPKLALALWMVVRYATLQSLIWEWRNHSGALGHHLSSSQQSDVPSVLRPMSQNRRTFIVTWLQNNPKYVYCL